MANIDKIIKSKYQPKQTNVAWVDLSGETPVEKHFINGRWVVVSGGGVTDYNDIKSKPTINGVELDGNKTSQQLGVYSKPSSGIPQSDLSSDVQSQLNKYFKGWFASVGYLETEYPSPVVGDYAYVKGAESTDPAAIYECTTAGSWSDSGRTADTSNVQTFASSQEVNKVHIVNDLTTGGTEDVLSAEQGKILGDRIGEYRTVTSVDNNTATKIIDTDIKSGELYTLILDSSVQWTRLIISTGTTSTSRFFDVTFTAAHFEKQFLAKENITKLYVLILCASTASVQSILQIGKSEAVNKNTKSIEHIDFDLYNSIVCSTNLINQYNDVIERTTELFPYEHLKYTIKKCTFISSGKSIKFDSSNQYTATHIIKVDALSYYVSNVKIRAIVYFDDAFTVIDSNVTEKTIGEPFQIPSGVSYIRCLIGSYYYENVKIVINKGQDIQLWEKPYRLGDQVDSMRGITRYSGNLVKQSNIQENTAISVSSSQKYRTSTSSSYNSILDFPIKAGITYVFSAHRNYQIMSADNTTVLDYSGSDDKLPKEITLVEDGLLSFCFSKYTAPFISIKSITGVYEAYDAEIITNGFNSIIKQASPLRGKTIFNFGDSVSKGGGNRGRGPAEILALDCGMICGDYSVNGATLTATSASSNVLAQINNAPSSPSPDFVMFAGGINDLKTDYGPVEVGIAPSFDASTTRAAYETAYINSLDITKISGCMENIINTIYTKWPNAIVIYMFEQKMYAHVGDDLNLHDVCVAVCKKWSVPVLDMYENGGINLAIPQQKAIYGANNGADGTHPNAEGYRKFYVPRLRALLESLCPGTSDNL